jgi:lysine 6-dehydrogenase
MRRPKVLLIGAGEQTKAVAHDLMRFMKPDLGIVDIDRDRAAALLDWLQKTLPPHTLLPLACYVGRLDAFNVADAELLMRGYDLVVNCAGNAMNPGLTKAAIAAGCHYVDIGHDTDIIAQQFAMHDAAKAAGVKVVPTCGIAPGAQAMMVMRVLDVLAAKDTSKVRIRVRCGGIPQKPRGVLGYRWAFSTAGLLTEYQLPTNVLRKGAAGFVEPMTADEEQRVKGFGVLEAAHTGGNTGTMIATLQDMGYQGDFDYKTLRYPGHWQKMRDFRELGLFGSQEFIQHLERYLLQYRDDPDALVLRVIAEDDRRSVVADLIDHYDPATGLSAMQRTTGYSAAIVGQMLITGAVRDTGVLRQEVSIPHDRFLAEWEKRGLHVNITKTEKRGRRRSAT